MTDRLAKFQATPANPMKTDHPASATTMVAFAPNRSASSPPGTWKAAYLRKEAVRIRPGSVCRG